jgi:hypothetical protein
MKSDPEKHTKIPDNYIIGGLCTTKMVINHYRLWYPLCFSTAKTIFLRHDPSLRSSCPQCRVGHRVRHHELIKTWNLALLSVSGVQKGKTLYFNYWTALCKVCRAFAVEVASLASLGKNMAYTVVYMWIVNSSSIFCKCRAASKPSGPRHTAFVLTTVRTHSTTVPSSFVQATGPSSRRVEKIGGKCWQKDAKSMIYIYICRSSTIQKDEQPA